MATNRIDEQEVSVLALHLLQASLVYVNTRMLQTVLAEPAWQGRMAPEDCRGLTPLIYAHVNPYGRFDLDLNSRIDFRASSGVNQSKRKSAAIICRKSPTLIGNFAKYLKGIVLDIADLQPEVT